jgi:hypothetical protein
MEGKRTCGMPPKVSFGFKVRIRGHLHLCKVQELETCFPRHVYKSSLYSSDVSVLLRTKKLVSSKFWYILVKHQSFKELKFAEIQVKGY